MEISTIIYGVVGVVISVILVAVLLLPTISDLTTGTDAPVTGTNATLITVVGTIALIIPIMLAVRLITNRD